MTAVLYFVARPDVVDCDIGGDRALLHLEDNTYFTMNDTASALWLALSRPRSVGDLVGVITERFEVGEARCRADVEAVLAAMLEAGIVRTAPPPVTG